MQNNSDMTAKEYSNFMKACTQLPAIYSDEVEWRHVSGEACIEEYIAVSKANDNSDGDNNDGNEDKNLKEELLVSQVKLWSCLSD